MEKDKTYEWFIKTDLSEYRGKWVALADEQVIVSGDEARTVMEEAKRKKPDVIPALAWIPDEGILIFVKML